MAYRQGSHGLISTLELSSPVTTVRELGGGIHKFQKPALIRFSGEVLYSHEMFELLKSWTVGEITHRHLSTSPIAREWLCLYCASANPTKMLVCQACGARRSWLLG